MADLYKDLVKAVKKHGSLDDQEIIDAGEHGADTGWAGFTYTKDTCEFYDKNEGLIWELLEEQADSMGSKNIMEFIGGFRQADQIQNLDNFKNLLAWFALEEAGRYLADQRESRR
jgi:hypothetical protein